MKYFTLSLTAVFLFAGIAAWADEPMNKDDKPPVKDLPDKAKKPDEKKPGQTEAEDETAKIVERLTKNTKTAEERLAKPDPGEETRKLQRDILRDIDELLKQFQKPPQSSDSSDSSSSSSSDSSSSAGGSASQPGGAKSKGGQSSAGSTSSPGTRPAGAQARQQRREQREKSRQQANGGAKQQQQPKTGNGSAMAQNNQQPRGEDGPKPNPQNPGPNGPGTEGGTGGKPGEQPPKTENGKLAEMYKDVWGHLPEKMRQEMDSYFKERFMPRYNDLLKQYYSTIAEQNKK